MARLKTIVMFGQSNIEGNGAFTAMTAADTERLFGVSSYTSLVNPGTDLEIPGINYWTLKRPHRVSGTLNQGAGATAGTTTSLDDTAQVWANDQWNGKWIQFLSGANLLQVRKILDTVGGGTQRLTWSSALSAAIAAGTHYVIYDAGTASVASYVGEWRPMRFYYPASISIPTTGYEYPNFKSMPRIWGFESFVFGPDIELGWQMREHLGEQIGILKLGIPSAYMTTFHGTLSNPVWSWQDPSIHNDWSPASTTGNPGSEVYDLFGLLTQVVFPAAQADAIAKGYDEGCDVVAVLQKEGESDTSSLERATATLETQIQIRDLMRAALGTNSMVAGDASKVLWIMAGHDETDGYWPYASTVNANFQQIAQNDPYAAYVDTTGLPYNVGDQAHLDCEGQLELGVRFFEAYRDLRKRQSSATTPRSTRRTLSQLRTLVKRRYERNGVSNDSATEQVDMFLNDSLREMYVAAGDDCWYLRRVEQLALTGGVNNLNNLPVGMARILRIEPVGYPRQSLAFEKVANVDEGSTQITLQESMGGEYYVHFMMVPPDLVGDGDTCLLPDQYVETLVALTCKRLAESAGSAIQSAYYAAESARLFTVYLRDIKRQARARKDSLKVRNHDTWLDHHYEDSLWRFP